MRRHVARRERAQVAVLFAIIVVALLGAVALVVDVGMLWLTQRELQKTADSAALAGVVLLPDAGAAAEQATWYAQQNLDVAGHLCTATPTVTSTAGQIRPEVGGGMAYTLTVTVHCPAGFMFGQLVTSEPTGGACAEADCTDLTSIPNDCNCVRASATAVMGSNRSPTCPAPLAVNDVNQGIASDGYPVFWGDPGITWRDMARNGSGYSFGQLVELHVDNEGATNGNFHAIQFGTDSGAGPYRLNLANRCASAANVHPGDNVLTQPGDMRGPTRNGLALRGLASCTGAGQPELCTNGTYPAPHPDFTLACPDNPIDLVAGDGSGVLNPDASVRRSSLCLTPVLVVVPEAFSAGGGRHSIQVEGFAEFFIAGYVFSDNTVWGMFVTGAPTLGELGAYDPFGTVVVRLIR